MVASPFQPMLDHGGVVILDGALATELERRGADLRDPLWSAKVLVENPELIHQVHLDYFAAGADVATTASYQASFEGFARRGLNRQQASALLRLSVRVAIEARVASEASTGARSASEGSVQVQCQENASSTDSPSEPSLALRARKKLVAASIGCYGAVLHDGSEYRGDYGLSRQQLIGWHRPRMEVLADSGADLLACETIPCLVEAEALVRLLEEFAVPAWLSFSCKDTRHLCHAEPLAEGIALANSSKAVVAAGINCTPPHLVEGLLEAVAPLAQKPLLAYPNSGEAWNASAQCWNTGSNAMLDWADAAKRWRQAGARIIGGCCRTTPEIIRRMAQSLRAA